MDISEVMVVQKEMRNRFVFYDHGYNILELCNILKFQFATSKAIINIYDKNITYELPHELLHSLRLRILQIWEILEKSHNWVITTRPALSKTYNKFIVCKPITNIAWLT